MPINAKTKLGGGALPKLAAQSAPASDIGQISVLVPGSSTDLLAINASGRYLFSGVRFHTMDGNQSPFIGTIRRIQIDGVDIFTSAGVGRSNFVTNRDVYGPNVHVSGQFLVETSIKIWVNTPPGEFGTLIVSLYAIE